MLFSAALLQHMSKSYNATRIGSDGERVDVGETSARGVVQRSRRWDRRQEGTSSCRLVEAGGGTWGTVQGWAGSPYCRREEGEGLARRQGPATIPNPVPWRCSCGLPPRGAVRWRCRGNSCSPGLYRRRRRPTLSGFLTAASRPGSYAGSMDPTGGALLFILNIPSDNDPGMSRDEVHFRSTVPWVCLWRELSCTQVRASCNPCLKFYSLASGSSHAGQAIVLRMDFQNPC